MNSSKREIHFAGPVLAIDLGAKLVGIAVSDELLVSIRRLDPLKRSNWKQLLRDVKTLIQRFDAQTLVIGLPLRLDGSVGEAATEASRLAKNFCRSLLIPVFLQDERLTSFEARQQLLDEGRNANEIPLLIDGEAASIILRDFLNDDAGRRKVMPSPANLTPDD